MTLKLLKAKFLFFILGELYQIYIVTIHSLYIVAVLYCDIVMRYTVTPLMYNLQFPKFA